MRKRKSLVRFLSLVVGVVLAGTGTMTVRAGSSELVTDASSYEKELSSALWKNRDEDVISKGDKIIFPDNSTETTSLISKTAAKLTGKHENLVTAKATLQFNKLPKGERFAMVLGLGSVESFMAEKGNIEIQFQNDNGVKAEVRAYTDDSDSEVIAKDLSCGSMSTAIRVDAVISSKQVLTLSLNGKQVVKKKLPVSGEGRVGFLESGSCGAAISDVEIVSYRYDNPQNVNATEDFEQGTLNTNVWSSKMSIPCYTYQPSGTNITQQDGNYVFQFQNSGGAYLGTKYQYSNFEFSFDVPYLQRKHDVDERGNIVTPKCENFAVCIGADTAECSGTEYTNAFDLIIFSGNSTVTSWNTKQYADASQAGYPYFAEDCNKGFSVKISVIDSVITVGMKWLDETKYTTVFQYQVTRENPLGYVQIWTTAGVANLSVDNLKIVNKDKEPDTIEIDFKGGKIEKPDDFAYEPVTQKMMPEKEDQDIFSWYYLPAGTGIFCLLAILLAVMIRKAKTARKEKGNEE